MMYSYEQVIYGEQTGSRTWTAKPHYPPSEDRSWANLGQPLRHLAGEPTPLALECLFRGVEGRSRRKLARRFFGKGKTGPK